MKSLKEYLQSLPESRDIPGEHRQSGAERCGEVGEGRLWGGK